MMFAHACKLIEALLYKHLNAVVRGPLAYKYKFVYSIEFTVQRTLSVLYILYSS